jgi:hypothetical protein
MVPFEENLLILMKCHLFLPFCGYYFIYPVFEVFAYPKAVCPMCPIESVLSPLVFRFTCWAQVQGLCGSVFVSSVRRRCIVLNSNTYCFSVC